LNDLRNLLRNDPAAALHAARQAGASRESPSGETAFIIGAALHALGRDEDAEVSLGEALRRNPAHQHAGIELAYLQRNQGRYCAVAGTVKALVAANPGDDALALHAIVFLRECRQHQAAEGIWQTLTADATAETSYLGGELAMALGDFTAARERFDRCLALQATHAGAILRRAHTGPAAATDPFPAHLQRLAEQRHRLPAVTRIAVDFALGKLALDRRAFADAFVHFDRGNAEQHAKTPWDRADLESVLHERSPAPAPASPAVQRGEDVVLIVGLPRSGTTLLATRLGQHPRIADRGELPWMGMIGRSPFTADMYLRHLRQDDAPKARYIDKNPLNFRHLDAVAREFPQARVLHCRRDPRDTAVSCYTQYFAHPDMAWSYAWDDIVAFQRGYRRLVDQRPQGIAWMDIDYSELVVAPEATLRRAIDFLGLAWDAAVLEDATDGPIATASAWQARQPLHARSLGRWRETASSTAPLLAAYGEQAEPRDWN